MKNKEELVNRWMYAYSKKLKPDLLLGRYKFLNEEKFNDWVSISFDSNDTAKIYFFKIIRKLGSNMVV
ncbi:MAG: hypothetical protein IPG53_11580 [Ignavibacteriales bacterium]|nr:hypothetical protein [Ignavibacteriales bacterium]